MIANLSSPVCGSYITDHGSSVVLGVGVVERTVLLVSLHVREGLNV